MANNETLKNLLWDARVELRRLRGRIRQGGSKRGVAVLRDRSGKEVARFEFEYQHGEDFPTEEEDRWLDKHPEMLHETSYEYSVGGVRVFTLDAPERVNGEWRETRIW